MAKKKASDIRRTSYEEQGVQLVRRSDEKRSATQ